MFPDEASSLVPTRDPAPKHRLQGMTIRPAQVEEAEAFVALRERVAAEGRWINEPHSPEELPNLVERVRNHIQDDACLVLVAIDEDSAIVGELALWQHSPGAAHNVGLQLDSQARGQDLGTRLLKEAISWAKANGVHKISLEVWPHNTSTIKLYRKAGFKEEGRLIQHYRRSSGEIWDAFSDGLTPLARHGPH